MTSENFRESMTLVQVSALLGQIMHLIRQGAGLLVLVVG